MSIVNKKGLRSVAIATLLIIGVASTIATGGGGSGGDGAIVPPPDGAPPPTLAITVANGEAVASAIVIAIGTSFDLGDITDDGLGIQSARAQPPVAGLGGYAGIYAKLLPTYAQKLEMCANGGTVDVTETVADPNMPTVGDQIVAVFDNCDDNEGYVMSGTADLTIAAIQGDVLTDVFLLGLDVVLTGIEISDSTGTLTANGEFTLTLDNLGFPVLGLSLTGDDLQLGTAGELITLTNFDHAIQFDTGVIPQAIIAEVFGRLGSQVLGGTVDYETPVAVHATGGADPHSGEILVTGADGATVRLVLVSSASISLEIDENGDGVIDAYLDTNWAALNGETSSINSSNAAILAREVFNAVTGFGSVTSTAGAQFMPLAPFGQLESLGVSGDFGPLEIACNAGGTATVSGSKALPGTFSPNDQLDASFSGCARGGEELWGDMNFVPGSFATTPGDAYLVTGTVVHTNLERTLGGNCFSGSGTFNTSYDFLFTTTGVIDINSSASSFTVNAGGRGQQVSDAAVSAQITVGQPPVTVTRQSSGTVTSEDLDGSFVYQSVVPDVFLVDEDTSTGPFSGELLVTASDNSTMRMVAMDEFNLVLELDADGDSVIDDEIATTWATLGYPGWICGPPQL